MLENRSIVCFAHDWGGDPTSKTHIMRILAGRNRVLWVNSIGMRRPAPTRSDMRRMATKLRAALSGCREVEPNLFVASPLALPLPGIGAADWLNARVLSAWLRGLCRKLGLERPILWSFLPTVRRLLGHLDERMVVYHCVDEYSAFSGVPREAIARMEEDLVLRADLVLASSERLRDERWCLNPNTHFVPHGVDLDHFSRAMDPKTEVPADLSDLKRPVIGFFGLIADWVDLSLIRALAEARPGASVALLGKVATDLELLRNVPNVHLLGQKPYGSLPAYCRGFDVGIVPFRINELTVRANPLKVREYLAAGLPVVSTRLPEVGRFEGLVHLATGAKEFVAAVDAALRENSVASARRRIEAMGTEAWSERVEQISEILDRTVPGPFSRPLAVAHRA